VTKNKVFRLQKRRHIMIGLLLGIIVTVAALNLTIGYVLNILVQSQIISLIGISIFNAIIISIILFIFNKRIRNDIKILEDFHNEYSKGNFLYNLKGNFKSKEFKSLEKSIAATREEMQDLLYNILNAEVNLTEHAKRLWSNSKESLSGINMISQNISDIIGENEKTNYVSS